MGDFRPSLDDALDAYGLPAVVTRPAPDNAPISTSGFWLLEQDDALPVGSDIGRREPRRLLVLPRAAVPTLPRGTTVAIAEVEGGATKTFRVERLARATEPDHWRAIVHIPPA
jgi:hypothetical protein